MVHAWCTHEQTRWYVSTRLYSPSSSQPGVGLYVTYLDPVLLLPQQLPTAPQLLPWLHELATKAAAACRDWAGWLRRGLTVLRFACSASMNKETSPVRPSRLLLVKCLQLLATSNQPEYCMRLYAISASLAPFPLVQRGAGGQQQPVTPLLQCRQHHTQSRARAPGWCSAPAAAQSEQVRECRGARKCLSNEGTDSRCMCCGIGMAAMDCMLHLQRSGLTYKAFRSDAGTTGCRAAAFTPCARRSPRGGMQLPIQQDLLQ